MNAKAMMIALAVGILVILGVVLVSNNARQQNTVITPTVVPTILPTVVPSPTTVDGTIPVTLEEQNNSSESGTAAVEELNGDMRVSINLTGVPSGVAQPAHFHTGTCAKPGPIKYPLTNVVEGTSETILNVNMDDFKKELPLILNVHKSAQQVQIYVACGVVEAK